jgi:hypothetical protein
MTVKLTDLEILASQTCDYERIGRAPCDAVEMGIAEDGRPGICGACLARKIAQAYLTEGT